MNISTNGNKKLTVRNNYWSLKNKKIKSNIVTFLIYKFKKNKTKLIMRKLISKNKPIFGNKKSTFITMSKIKLLKNRN